MVRHLIRSCWRRRRANALLAAEIGGAFLVLSLLATAAWQLATSWRRPLGFDPRDSWVAIAQSREGGVTAEDLARAARSFEHVLVAATSSSVPYESGEDSWHFQGPTGLIDAEFATVSDEALEAWGLSIVDGRWFREGDDALGWIPVVVDRDFARALRPDGRVVGETLPGRADAAEQRRIIGVISDFRRRGEASERRPFLLLRAGRGAPVAATYLVLKMRPGTPATVEPHLLRHLDAALPGLEVTLRRVEDSRRQSMREVLVALGGAGILAGFLVAMVALGLVGVLWQNVARRTREIGLHRALGAAPADIRRLVLGEAAVIASAAILGGLVVMLQIALFSLLPGIEPASHVLGVATAGLAMLALVAACSLPPAMQAMRVTPADALRQE